MMIAEHQRPFSGKITFALQDMVPADVERGAGTIGIGAWMQETFFEAKKIPCVNADWNKATRLAGLEQPVP